MLGGMGTLWGPVVGASILTFVPQLTLDWPEYHLYIYGGLLLFALFFMPMGLMGSLRSVFSNSQSLNTSLNSIINVERQMDSNSGVIQKELPGSKAYNILHLKDVSKNFEGVLAVNGINLDIRRGGIEAIIGPNGSGKTTLMNLISGNLACTSGNILLENETINNKKPYIISRKGVKRVFQQVRVFQNMTVLENVLVALHLDIKYNILDVLLKSRHFRREENKATLNALKVLEFVGLENKYFREAKNLSLVEQRCLEIARAIALKPSILLLDEPAGGLSKEEIDKLVCMIEEINKQGITILLIEHHVDVVMRLADKVTVLNFGKKIAEGIPEEVKSKTEVIEAYLGG
jgi:branched-chain amino acid transport system permease protein